jgi:hypothetical protein
MRGVGDDSDQRSERAELEPESDAALVEDGWATVTPLVGVRENLTDAGAAALAAALATHVG